MADAPDTTAAPRIPYGRADFRGIRLDGSLYVDKTAFLRPLEDHNYVLFIRPRRFGKTCWLRTLECYYGRHHQDEFEAIFGGTNIGAAPTALRGRYLVLRFNFSGMDAAPERMEERFEECCDIDLRASLRQNEDVFDEDAMREVRAQPSINTKLRSVFAIARKNGLPVYVLVDEYDNLANTVLARYGQAAYHALTRDDFYQSFFATLKEGADTGTLERLFVTGVSPLGMDDLISGFNIGRNLSLNPKLNAMLGFTEKEARRVLNIYYTAGEMGEHPDDALATMRRWYNGYRFATDATEDVYNPYMVLYYVAESLVRSGPPSKLIDDNVRVDYGKLRHLLTIGGRLNGNFDLLRAAMAEGRAECRVKRSFPPLQLDDPHNFLSLLHFFGLLSIRRDPLGEPELVVPNQTARKLLHVFLRDASHDVGAFESLRSTAGN